ncbi:MAG: hypothetical protein HKN72_02530 [Gemmatimonadetes bacterium]|nr:hypothetical protein [Gemmatimonadota bacterium]
MTVGRHVAQRTGLLLFHNHMSIEPVLQLFPFGSPPFNRLVSSFRNHVFDEVLNEDAPGLIFTYVWALDEAGDRTLVDELVARFESRGARTHFVELFATQEERLRRNRTDLRLAEKPSKRDVQASEQRLLENDERFRLNTDGDFFYPERHVRIDNTHRTASDVAEEIVKRLGLPLRETSS